MRAHCIIIFLFTSLIIQSTSCANPKLPDFIGENKNRRILHQPLFPATSAPPPETELFPPPPPPETSDSPDLDQPFSNELPTGPLLDQGQTPPPPPSPPLPENHAAVANRDATWQPSNPIKKVAVAISSVVLTLGTLSALAFYLYKHREKRHDESRKLVGGNSERINEEDSRMPPSTSLYIGTPAEPSTRNLVDETNNRSGSPYRKLNPGKRFDPCVPGPDLQPLPPLTNAPPPMLSSYDESHKNVYMSNKSPSSLPHSKRTSPKSRFSSPDTKSMIKPSIKQSTAPPPPKSRFSSPDMKSMIKPSIKQSTTPPPPPPPPPTNSSLGPLHSSKTLSYNPKRANLSERGTYKIPTPPPPPPLSIPRKYETYTPLTVSKQLIRSESKIRTPKAAPVAEKTSPVEEVNNGASSWEKFDAEDKDGSRAKLKPLRWDKVQATSERATIWDQLKSSDSSSFQLNEDAMESLFGCNSASLAPKEATTKMILPPVVQEKRVLDSRKSQNIAILLRALNVTREEVSEALLDGNPQGLGPDLLETLVKMAPTKEEEIKLKNYNGESSKLGPAERFLKAILDIPFAFKRVEAMLYIANFETEVQYLRKSFQTLEEASQELKSSRLFLKLLEAVLRTGNRMNDGTNRGDAKAFKLDTLLKLVDIKATDGKTTLVHFVVQEIIKSEGAGYDPTSETLSNKTSFKFKEDDFKKQGLQVVAGLSKELGNVKRAAGMDSDVLSNYVSKLEMGLQKVREVLQYENHSIQDKFFDSMKVFHKEAVDEISKVKAEERKALSLVKDVTQYFHGDAVKVEAHPFRIFMIVRDFLAVLDNVCKDVGRMQDRTTIGAGRSFRIPITASLPVLSRYNVQHDRSSDDDSM